MSTFTDALVAAARTEWERFERGKKTETADPQYLYVGEYWTGIKKSLTGRTTFKRSDGTEQRPAWSAAFVSFCVRKAGAGEGFKYAEAHSHYVEDAIRAREFGLLSAAYYAFQPDEYIVSVGDILVAGREYAINYDYHEARATYEADSFYPSHGDIVVAVDKTKKALTVIGGNLGNSVKEKTVAIDANGLLEPRKEKAGSATVTRPWIAVLGCRV